MPRKKKSEQETTENTIIELKKASSSFAYTGKINVSVGKGDKKFLTKKFSNHGRWPLFHFLNMCLRGDYDQADAFKPRLISAFGYSNLTGTNCPKIFDIPDGSTPPEENQIKHYFNSTNQVTLVPWPYQSRPDILTTSANVGKSELTFKFTIPFTQLDLDKFGRVINSFALYSAAQNDMTEPTLFFFLTDKDNKVVNLLEGLDNIGNEYNLYIEWTLSINNIEETE